MAIGKKTGGRQKGVANKDKQELLDLIESTGCEHPITGLAMVAKQAHDEGDLVIAGNAYKELAQYVAPKRKAIEHTGEIETNQPLVIVVPEVDAD